MPTKLSIVTKITKNPKKNIAYHSLDIPVIAPLLTKGRGKSIANMTAGNRVFSHLNDQGHCHG